MRSAILPPILLAALLLPACGRQQRVISITSEPSGAIVWLNDYELGRTPVEAQFKFFGNYDVRLVKEGFEPLVTSQEAVAPLHEYPGIDLIATAIPGTRRTRLQWHFKLAPAPELARRETAEAALRERAQAFKSQAQTHTEVDDAPPARPPANPGDGPPQQ